MDNITIDQTDKTNNNPKKRIEKDGESGGSEYASGLQGIAGNPGRT